AFDAVDRVFGRVQIALELGGAIEADAQLFLQLANGFGLVVRAALEVHRSRFGGGEAIDLLITLRFDAEDGGGALRDFGAGDREVALETFGPELPGGEALLQVRARGGRGLQCLLFLRKRRVRAGERGFDTRDLSLNRIAVARETVDFAHPLGDGFALRVRGAL